MAEQAKPAVSSGRTPTVANPQAPTWGESMRITSVMGANAAPTPSAE